MTTDLAHVLTQEHHDIDTGIEDFHAALERGEVTPAPLRQAMMALRRHIYLEEELLFPAIRRAGMLMPVMVMLREHGEVWGLMDQLDGLLGAADPDVPMIRSTSERLLAGLAQHNAKEEPIIYPQTASDLTPEESDVLADFIAAGITPQGWVCEAARQSG